MNKKITRIIGSFIMSLMVISCASQVVNQTEMMGSSIKINDDTFTKEVKEFPGFALVLFYSADNSQSKDMEKRFVYFSDKYPGDAKFCKFLWDVNADPKPYNLEKVPTVVLYKEGVELDRIKGIPPDEKKRLEWNKDIDLWLMKNVLGLKGDKYTGDYKYLFNNDYKLDISSY